MHVKGEHFSDSGSLLISLLLFSFVTSSVIFDFSFFPSEDKIIFCK